MKNEIHRVLRELCFRDGPQLARCKVLRRQRTRLVQYKVILCSFADKLAPGCSRNLSELDPKIKIEFFGQT